MDHKSLFSSLLGVAVIQETIAVTAKESSRDNGELKRCEMLNIKSQVSPLADNRSAPVIFSID